MTSKIIAHIDMDAFFVSVEEAEKPWLKGKPVVVAGNSYERSVVATASYEARKFGVHSAIPLFIAKRLCSNVIVLKANIAKYNEVSRKIIGLYNSFCPVIEQTSIDEAFLDLTYVVKNINEAINLVKLIKQSIAYKFSLPATVGISCNKMLAKLASKLGKPDGLFVINDENKDNILITLPVDKISGVGEKTSNLLYEEFGVKTLGDLRRVSIMKLYSVFHSRALFLHNASFGRDISPFVPNYEKPQESSVGNSTTLPADTADMLYIKRVLKYLSERVGMGLRKRGLFSQKIIIIIRYANFHTVSRGKKVFATNSTEVIYMEALTLLKRLYTGGKIRLVGVTASNLGKGKPLSLFEDESGYKEVDDALDKIKLKYGDNIADYGSLINFEK